MQFFWTAPLSIDATSTLGTTCLKTQLWRSEECAHTVPEAVPQLLVQCRTQSPLLCMLVVHGEVRVYFLRLLLCLADQAGKDWNLLSAHSHAHWECCTPADSPARSGHRVPQVTAVTRLCSSCETCLCKGCRVS